MSKTQSCGKCDKENPLTEEFWHRSGKHSDGSTKYYKDCKDCVREKNNKAYSQNKNIKESVKKSHQQSVNALKKLLHEDKESKKCEDCIKEGNDGKWPYYVLDYDHRPDQIKKFELSRGFDYAKQAILDEIKKCDVVCANHHRLRTAARLKKK